MDWEPMAWETMDCEPIGWEPMDCEPVDWEPVDGGAPVLHECEEIVEEAFSSWIHVELVQLQSQVVQISNVI